MSQIPLFDLDPEPWDPVMHQRWPYPGGAGRDGSYTVCKDCALLDPHWGVRAAESEVPRLLEERERRRARYRAQHAQLGAA